MPEGKATPRGKDLKQEGNTTPRGKKDRGPTQYQQELEKRTTFEEKEQSQQEQGQGTTSEVAAQHDQVLEEFTTIKEAVHSLQN